MSSNDTRYKITNTTVKQPRLNKLGIDTRKAVEKVGHMVKFTEGDNERILPPGRTVIVTRLDAGLISLEHGGFVKIEKIANSVNALRNNVYDENVARKSRTKLSKANIVEMGKDGHKGNSGSEYEDAVNPDGDPNFLVKVKRETDATIEGNNEANGESEEISSSIS